MTFTAPRGPVPLPNALIDTSPLSRGITHLGNALADRRKRLTMQEIGQAAQSGDLGAASQAAYGAGELGLGLQFGNVLAQRNARTAAAARQQSQDAESKRRFDLTYGLQKRKADRQDKRSDPAQAYAVRAEQAKQYGLDPRTPEGRQYVLTGKLGTQAKQTIFSQRHEAAVGLGLQPGTEQHKIFVLTGKVEKPQESTAEKISGGLNRLATVPSDVGRQSFEYATGPLQGDENAAWFNPGPPLARAWGSLANSVFGNATATTDVRNRIAGDVEALAAVIKPLIRKPGEGPWTDADQKRLVAVVGSLAESNNADEYARNLENVRQRIIANFGIDLPPIAGATQGQQVPQQLPPGVTVRRVR